MILVRPRSSGVVHKGVDEVFGFLISPDNPELRDLKLDKPLEPGEPIFKSLRKWGVNVDVKITVLEFEPPYRVKLRMETAGYGGRRGSPPIEFGWTLSSSAEGTRITYSFGTGVRSLLLAPLWPLIWLGEWIGARRGVQRIRRAINP